MGIHLLPTEVVDQIAAGEVVERPAHLVKELVENSLDAGADHITLEYSEGGRYVKVVDNGSGIDPADLPKALQRFATSKIEKAADLWRLNSFGFRGEALASIASVSRLTLISRRAGVETGSRLIADFGKMGPIENVGGSFGTTLVVEDLFSNVPARLKFLKTAAAEGSQIKTVMKALALAYPQVAFKVLCDGQLIFQWLQASSHLQRAQDVLEVEKLYLGESTRQDIRVQAVFADPNTTAKTSKNIWLFAQNRWIQDRSLQVAVQEAYRQLLMHGEFPIAAVWVQMDPENIDVNIHPTKSQVKFVQPGDVFRAVQSAVRGTLEKAPWVQSLAEQHFHTDIEKNPTGNATSTSFMAKSPEPSNFQFQDQNLDRVQFPKKEMLNLETLKKYAPAKMRPTASFASMSKLDSQLSSPPVEVLTTKEETPTKDFISDVKETPRKFWSQLDVLGQAHSTYILAQSEKSLFFIDQHAAHERINYEQIMFAWKQGTGPRQDYLFPLVIDLSEEKVQALQIHFPELHRLGIELEVLGPGSVGVKSAAPALKESAIAQVIEKVAFELCQHGDSFQFEKWVGDLCATLACHSSIRAGQALSLPEMKSLLIEMDAFPLSTFCPHGRPVFVEYPFYRLEKDFGRIV